MKEIIELHSDFTKLSLFEAIRHLGNPELDECVVYVSEYYYKDMLAIVKEWPMHSYVILPNGILKSQDYWAVMHKTSRHVVIGSGT
mgnify:FL=1